MTARTTLRTHAWRLVGLTRSERGVLALAGGRLSFVTRDGLVFEAPLSEVSGVSVPWYYVGGGIRLRVRAERYRFSFVRPNDDWIDADRLVPTGVGGPEGRLERWIGGDIAQGRRVCRAWRAALGA